MEIRSSFAVLVFVLLCSLSFAQFNYEENLVGEYALPNVLEVKNKKIQTAREWEENREYWLQLFSENVYGFTPREIVRFENSVIEEKVVFDGLAKRFRIKMNMVDYPELAAWEVLFYIPQSKASSFPLAMGLNFMGNHSTSDEIDIPISKAWARTENHVFDESSRALQKDRWNIKTCLEQGIALATCYYGDIEPDFPEGWKMGIRSVLGEKESMANWGALGAWAWGMSRILDMLLENYPINEKAVFLTGHSRIGKAALWAAAQDQRFTAVNSNNSGEGGAALSRRNFGETIERINTNFPHWFCAKYKSFNGKPSELPVDQHILLALQAPRPLYVSSASEDLWADPHGEFLSLCEAEKVYALYGLSSIKKESEPDVNQPVGAFNKYHIRQGKHDITPWDWQQYYSFIQNLSKK